MKIRNGYVSNSSSSSFVVIEPIDNSYVEINFMRDLPCEGAEYDKAYYVPLTEGNTWFSRGKKDYYDTKSKMNWTVMQAYYAKLFLKNRKPLVLLQKLFKEHSIDFYIPSQKELVDFNDACRAFIDHQSTVAEDSKAMEIFESMEKLKNFLFSTKSYIHTDDDDVVLKREEEDEN